MEFRNARWNEHGGIDAEINHPDFGWMPNTIDQQARPDLYSAAADVAEPYVPPTPPTAEEILAQKRSAASMGRTAFCLALKSHGILSGTEAVLAAKGGWPATFAAFLIGKTQDEQDAAQIEWAGAQNILYLHPLLQEIALAHYGHAAAAEAGLDLIFGVS